MFNKGLQMIKKVKKLSRNEFMKYGSVLDWDGAKLSSTSENHDYWDCISEFHPDGTVVCSFLRIKKNISKPIDEMECHLNTEEILVVLEGDIVINVALAGNTKDSPDESTINSFYIKQGNGIILKPGIWHALPSTVSLNNSMLLIVFKKNTSYCEDKNVDTDIYFAKLKSPFKLEL
jgi:ureidoglycolate hydrolase